MVDVGLVPDVAADRERSTPGLLDARDRLVDGAGQSVGMRVDGPRRTDDRGAVAGEPDREALADPARGAREDDDPTGEVGASPAARESWAGTVPAALDIAVPL